MFYIHQSACVSAQKNFSDPVTVSENNKLYAVDGHYEHIPLNILRRLGRAVKMGLSTGLEIISQQKVDGIVIGTSNGGLEDCIKFLNQIIEFEEGRLTPTNFVQSTTNAIAGQLGIMSSNKGYNITHVHRGLAFENALLDIDMLLKEHPENQYLVGGVDEISDYNYTIEELAHSYKKEPINSLNLLTSHTEGTIAGDGAAMFLVNSKKENAPTLVKGIKVFQTLGDATDTIKNQLNNFLNEVGVKLEELDVLISGKNGDVRVNYCYDTVESMMHPTTSILHYKQYVGEFPTVSAVALWIGNKLLSSATELPVFNISSPSMKNVLLYNNYKGKQHSFILLSKA